MNGDVPVTILRRMGVVKQAPMAPAESPVTAQDMCGAGRGEACGDLPVAALRGIKTQQQAHDADTLTAVSWNACGLGEGCIEDVVDMLDESVAWDFLLCQEGARAEANCRTTRGGHRALSRQRFERAGESRESEAHSKTAGAWSPS